MNPERREAPRVPAVLETVLEYKSKGFHYSATHDISLEGAFIKMAPDRVRKRARLDLAIKLSSNGNAAKFHRFQAKVVRVDNRGAALKFLKLSTESYSALLDVIFSREQATSA